MAVFGFSLIHKTIKKDFVISQHVQGVINTNLYNSNPHVHRHTHTTFWESAKPDKLYKAIFPLAELILCVTVPGWTPYGWCWTGEMDCTVLIMHVLCVLTCSISEAP